MNGIGLKSIISTTQANVNKHAIFLVKIIADC